MMLRETKCEKNSKLTKNRKIHLILQFCTYLCIEIRPGVVRKTEKKVKNTQLPEVRVCTLRKYAKCTKVEKKQQKKAQKFVDRGSISSPAFVWKAFAKMHYSKL